MSLNPINLDFLLMRITMDPRKQMACISQLSSSCPKIFLTTLERRICKYCSEIIHNIEYGEGTGKATGDLLEKQAHETMVKFWNPNKERAG